MDFRFRRALNHPFGVIVSPPYLDAWGTGMLISMSKVLKVGDENEQTIVGTISGDLSIAKFHKLLQGTVDGCNTTQYRYSEAKLYWIIILSQDFCIWIERRLLALF